MGDATIRIDQERRGLSASGFAWAAWQGGRDPYIILIGIYVFMPYVATVMVGDPVAGQAMIAGFATIGGIIAALTAPVLGASADRIGPRKPLLLALAILFVPLVAALWWARPDGSGLGVQSVLILTLAISMVFAYSEVLHNSQIPYAARSPKEAATLSGLALALGNVVSVAALLFVLWAFALPGSVNWPFVPTAPLFGLDPATAEPSRIVAPIAAGLFVLGAIPMFLLTADAPRMARPRLLPLISGAIRDLASLIKGVRGHRDAAVFLGARMLYSDAQIALITFSGVYAAGVMGWNALEMLGFGILMSLFAALGGFLSSVLDRAIGPKRSVQVELAATMIGLVALVGVSPEGMRFVFEADPNAAPLWNGPIFTTVPEIVYLALGGFVAIANTAALASSRTMLTHLTPPGRSGAFFGLYALAGTATVWLGPLLVQTAVNTFGTQQAGTLAIVGLLATGFVVLSLVRGGGKMSARDVAPLAEP